MVSIWQALKVTLIFIFFGLIPFIVFIFAVITIQQIMTVDVSDGVSLSIPVDSVGGFLGFSVLAIISALIFFMGLFKGIGDITEAALIE